MKKLFATIAAVVLTVSANAQFATGPRPGEATSITPATTLRVIASSQTNIATAGISNPFRISGTGNVGFYSVIASTNASSAAVAFVFQISQDGANWIAVPAPQGASWTASTLNGTTGVYHFTNAWTSAALQNVGWIRLSNITNGHTASLWVTNATFYQH